ncbi:MAG TPA: ornithine carbamoyltransferase [candidate division Zixibacteria bacterium]|nr:ornithine carbamoyltransferase [candidate division Zixibacteria bacterium]
MKRDFLAITDFSTSEIKDTLTIAKVVKHMHRWGDDPKPLAGKHAALMFRKPSLRTRASFETGIRQLGGDTLFFSDAEIGMGKRESVHDVAKVMSRFFDLVVIRTFAHEEIVEFAKHAEVPVINALTDLLHPCQIMGDIFTIMEYKNRVDDLVIAYVGDGGNNIANSWVNLASRLSLQLRIGTTEDRQPDPKILETARNAGLSEIIITDDPVEAVRDADVVYTDVWASMGEKDKIAEREQKLKKFQVNAELLSHAKPDVIFMHCLPAERGREVTDEVMDGPHSVVFDQAENRLHIQKAIILQLFGERF